MRNCFKMLLFACAFFVAAGQAEAVVPKKSALKNLNANIPAVQIPWSQGIDVKADSLAVQRIKTKMKEIRRKRPSVALVLSGGGAKGAAHVGVIKYLSELDIPVDIVLGTSMGGLVGGLYAMGYDAAYLDSLVHVIDWNNSLTDKVQRKYISYARSKYKEKYIISFPFYYAKKDYMRQRELTMKHAQGNKYEKLHLGANMDKDVSVTGNNLLESLPSGMVFGQNVSQIFSSLTVGYQDSLAFYELPVPFVCVATELVTAGAKVWYEGKINTALRSTMSIPGLYTPVKTDGMVLVDGGMRNNYPADIARDLGADVIIGVDLSMGYGDYSSINNLGDIIIQGVNMLGRASYEKNIKIPDITIRPALHEYNMMSFDKEAIDTIVNRGYRAAKEQKESLMLLKSLVNGQKHSWRNKRAIDINVRPVSISKVEIVGVDDRESEYLMGKIGIMAGQVVDRNRIEDAVATIFGTGSFDYVNYELSGREEPFGLRILCKKGPVNQFGLSARFDNEELVSVLANVGINAHKLQGRSYDFTAKIGTNPYFNARMLYFSKKGTTLNLEARFNYTDRNIIVIDSDVYKVNFFNLQQSFYLSNIRWANFDLNMGLKNHYFNISSIMGDNLRGDIDVDNLQTDNLDFFVNGRIDTFDDGYFPSSGFTAGLSYDWMLPLLSKSGSTSFHVFQADVKYCFPIGKSVAFIPSVNARILMGDKVPLRFLNFIGGNRAGRYLEQQLPFIGVNNVVAVPDILNIYRVDVRVMPFQNNYITTTLNYASMLDSFLNLGAHQGAFGVGLEYSYYTIAGPWSVTLHWSDLTKSLGMYFSFGFNF